MLEFIPLSSGSKGNATLIRSEETTLLVDAGLPRKEMLERIAAAGQDASEIDGLLLTHRHLDHCRAAATIARRHKIALYATSACAEHQQPETLPELQIVQPGLPFTIGAFEITPVRLAHDSPETVAYCLEYGKKGEEPLRIGIITDLGSAGGGLQHVFQDLDILLLEFNHDTKLLMDGSYPWFLKHRIRSKEGHLSNQQAKELLKLLATSRLRCLYLAHLSSSNNRRELALDAAERGLAELGLGEVEVRFAEQDGVSEVFRV